MMCNRNYPFRCQLWCQNWLFVYLGHMRFCAVLVLGSPVRKGLECGCAKWKRLGDHRQPREKASHLNTTMCAGRINDDTEKVNGLGCPWRSEPNVLCSSRLCL